MNKITVTVSGCAGTGKSTIAELITRSLELHGFNVAMHHSHNEVNRKQFLGDLYKKANALFEKGTKIDIYEKQESRTATNDATLD